MTTQYDCYDACAVEIALNAISGKWKGMILFLLLHETLHFNELRRRMSGITPRVLTRQLRELEAAGLVKREVLPVAPPHVEYSITAFGETLKPIIMMLLAWGEEFDAQQSPEELA